MLVEPQSYNRNGAGDGGGSNGHEGLDDGGDIDGQFRIPLLEKLDGDPVIISNPHLVKPFSGR
jgi:hypothetical protein